MGDGRRWHGVVLASMLVLAGGRVALGLHLELVLVGPVAGALGAVAVTALLLAIRHARLAARLGRASHRHVADDVEVDVVPGVMPAVAGLVRPRIFVDDDALAGLEAGQRRAVLLHEQAHRDHRDPARLVLLEAVRRCLGWIPGVAAAEQSARARLEIRADRYAIQQGARRADLAAALLRLAPAPSTAATATFGAVAEQRLRALVDDRDVVPRHPCWAWIAGSLALAVGLAVSASLSGTAHPELAWLVQCLEGACFPQ